MLVDGQKVHEHTTHFDDCGCLSARYEARIALLESAIADLKTVAQLRGDLLAERDAEVHGWMEEVEKEKRRAEAAERRVGELEALIRATEKNFCEEHGSADDDDGGEGLTPTCSICAVLLEAEKIGAKAKRRAIRDGGKGEKG